MGKLIVYNKDMQEYTITEVGQQLGVSPKVVRRFCNAGLVPHVNRNRRHYRVFEPWQIDLLNILMNMEQAGFTSKEIRQYSRFYRQGKQTEKERLAMLTTRKHQLRQEISERQKAIDFIERQEELAQNGNE